MTATIVAAVGLLTACGGSGHGGAAAPRRPASSYHMAAPAAYRAADLNFVNRTYVYLAAVPLLARQAAARSAAPEIRQLAAGLSTVQQGTAQQLSGWLRQWGKSLPAMPASASEGSWPGLPTRAEISRLAQLTPASFDRAFLRLVIADQQGVLAAAALEQEGGAFGPARQLAGQLVSSSTLAIVRMKQILRAAPR